MKRAKPALAALTAVCLLLCLCACTDNPRQTLADALDKLAELDSLSYSADVTLSMSAQDVSFEAKSTCLADLTSSPAALTLQVSTDLGRLGAEQYTAYAVPSGGVYSAYILLPDGWVRQDLSGAEALGQYDIRSGAALWASSLADIRKVGSEQLGARRATRYDCTAGTGTVDAVMSVSGAYESLSVLGITRERALELLSGLGEMTYSVWIDDEQGLPLRFDVDMTGIMDRFLENLPGGMGESLSIDLLTVRVELSNFDAVEPIAIPPEAIGAQPYAGSTIF